MVEFGYLPCGWRKWTETLEVAGIWRGGEGQIDSEHDIRIYFPLS
jgi:hypothetical protein